MSDLFKGITSTADTTKAPEAVVTKPAVSTEPVKQATVAPVPVVVKAPEPVVDDNEVEEPPVDENMPDELTMLKSRATMMSIPFSNNIGIDALKQKILEKMEGTKSPDNEKENEPEEAVSYEAPVQMIQEGQSNTTGKLSLRQKIYNEAMALIRCRITNLDPKKKDLNGEIFTVANEYLGTVKKFIPYGEVTDNGYHIPKCLYDNLKEREFTNITSRKLPGGKMITEYKDVREFAIEVLPPLTEKELAQLKTAQLASQGME